MDQILYKYIARFNKKHYKVNLKQGNQISVDDTSKQNAYISTYRMITQNVLT